MENVRLTQRDLRILELLLQRRCETLEHLRDAHFTGQQIDTARKRLSMLARQGYVSRTTTIPQHERVLEPQAVYVLGPKARRALQLRSLAGDLLRDRRFNPTLRETSIPHQLATNRVGDWIGARLVPEHHITTGDGITTRHRPDAIYRAAQCDNQGRQLVYLEIDLGHYTRHRILDKMHGFLQSTDARSIIIAVPSRARLELITRWITDAYGYGIMDRVQPRTFDQLRNRNRLDAGTEPADDGPPSPFTASGDVNV